MLARQARPKRTGKSDQTIFCWYFQLARGRSATRLVSAALLLLVERSLKSPFEAYQAWKMHLAPEPGSL